MGKSSDKDKAVTRIGLDLAKNVFQVHGVDAKGDVVVIRKLRRSAVLEFFRRLPPCLVAMEACGSAPSVPTMMRQGPPWSLPLRA